MAEIRKVVRSPSLSTFQNVAPEAGGTFRALAEAANVAYERLRPAALKEMEARGTEAGNEWVRQQFGDPMKGLPSAPSGSYRAAIQKVESGGNYGAMGPVTKSGDRAYGAYQVMGANVGPWTEKHFGQRLTPEQFLANREAQDAVFDGEFGSYVARFGNPQDAASMWFSGRPMSKAGNASDGYNTTPEYVRKFTAALGSSAPETAPTLVRTSAGKMEPRLYSPLGGEFQQAHNAAAGVAYTSGVMLKGLNDMMSLSNEYPLDPEGFRGAARAYVDDIVSQAPEQFRTDIRASLEKEMTRRFLGVTEDKQRDIRQRADNNSFALVERWTDNLAEAMASGNKDEIDSARAELDSLLLARESLPGVAWTPAQSENVILKAADQAERIRASRASEVRKQNQDALETIISAAKEGLHAGNEAILSDPAIQAALPDLWQKAAGAVTLRDWMPTFKAATPAQQKAAIESQRAEPVTNDLQIATVKAMEDAHADAKKAWDTDPIAYADKVLPQKPPPLPDFTSGDPNQFTKALAARREYALGLKAQGYVDFDAFLTQQEASDLGLALGKEMPPEVRLAISSALVVGFGDDAAKVFRQIKSNDPVTLSAGMFAARGGSAATSMEAMQGQALIDAGVVALPEASKQRGAITPGMATALLHAGVSGDLQGEVMKFASAIYASRARGLDPKSQEAIGIMKESVQAALGQSRNRKNELTGGVQKIGNNDVLLPIGVSGDALTDSLEKAFTTGPKPEQTFWQSLDMFNSSYGAQPNPDMWLKAGAKSAPKMDYSAFNKGHVRLTPVRGNIYSMQIEVGDTVSDVQDAEGNVLTFDVMKLIEAAQ